MIFLIGLRIAVEEINLNQNLEQTIIKIIFSVMAVTIAFFIYKIFDAIIKHSYAHTNIKKKIKIDKGLASFFYNIVKIIFFIGVFLYILSAWGVSIGPFLTGLGIAGIAVAFALQSTLSSVFGGISILLDKTIRLGDLIYLDQQTKGKVVKTGLRSTQILTFDNELLIVPNSKLADSIVQNIALPEPKARVVIQFGVAYGSDISKVKKIILSEIKKMDISKDPEPNIRFIEMADSSLNFKAYFYVDTFEDRFGKIDEANTRIYNALNKNKISIPFPQMDVHIKKK